MVAIWRDFTNGVRDIEAAKMRWLYIQAVTRSGLYFAMVVTKGAIPGGGLGVKPLWDLLFSYSGDCTTQGRSTEPMSVMIEKTIKASDPTRPTSPRISFGVDVAE